MMEVKIRWDARSLAVKLRKKSETLTGPALKGMLYSAAKEEVKRIAERTPKGFTGKAKKSWGVRKSPQGLAVTIYTTSAVAKFLDEGTKAHGPVNSTFLFIPLTSRARLAQQRRIFPQGRNRLIHGIDYIMTRRVKGIKRMNLTKGSAKAIQKDVAERLKASLNR